MRENYSAFDEKKKNQLCLHSLVEIYDKSKEPFL